MNREEWKNLFLTGGGKRHLAGVVYSKEQTDELLKQPRGNITGMIYSNEEGEEEETVEFFTNNSLVWYPHIESLFCSCSMTTPMDCVERPGCEDGIINTLDKYQVVFKRTRYLWSVDEVIDFLATKYRVTGEEPEVK